MELRAPWLWLVLAVVPACQCFVPVVEEAPDAGQTVDAGQVVDAGRDGGAADGGECLTAAECTAAPWASRWCLFGTPAALSCVEQRCVSECAADAGRTCTYDAGSECMGCGAEPLLCNADTCPTSAFTGTVSSVECRAGVTPPLTMGMTLSFVPIRGASCEMSVSSNVGGVGQVVRGNQDWRHYWFIRSLGGWCVGEELPTGAIRSMVACPDCTFGVEGF